MQKQWLSYKKALFDFFYETRLNPLLQTMFRFAKDCNVYTKTAKH